MAGRQFGFPFADAKLVLVGSLLAVYVPGLWNYRGLLQRAGEVVMLIGLAMMVEVG
jgi:hypothetical protein